MMFILADNATSLHNRFVQLRAFHALLVVLPFAFMLFVSTGCNRAAPAAEEKAPPAPVKWEPPISGALEEWIELIGTSVPVPDRVARVTTPVEGRVVSLFGDSGATPIIEGQRVEKGTVLCKLESKVVEANIAKVEANQEVIKEEIKQAQLAVDLAASEVERLRILKVDEDKYPPGTKMLVSPVDRLKADFAHKDAISKLKAANGRLVASSKELDLLRVTLQQHTLVSPIAGRVGRAQVVRGQTLAIGALVAEVMDLDEQIDVICYVPPSLINRLSLKMPALTGGFERDPASKAVQAEGEIVFMADQAEPETGNFMVKFRFANNEAHLRANSVVRIRVLTKPGRECLSIRESAVQEDEEVPTVVIVTDVKVEMVEGKEETRAIAKRLNVTLGVRDRALRQVEILALDDPEKDPAKRWKGDIKDALFIVEGAQGLQTGDIVKLDVDVD